MAPLDEVIVFGQGPIREVKIEGEFTQLEKAQWNAFKADPFSSDDLDFFVIESKSALDELAYIDNHPTLTFKEKQHQKALLRAAWQGTSTYALKRFGRINALAGGLLLVDGVAKELILTGGHTASGQIKKRIQNHILNDIHTSPDITHDQMNRKIYQYLRYFMRWPSEAEMMADIIRRYFGYAYREKYGRNIDEVIKIESNATNTLENVTCVVNAYPYIYKKRVGIVSVSHHLRRIQEVTDKLGLKIAPHACYSSQEVLAKRFRNYHMTDAESTMHELQAASSHSWLQALQAKEKTLLRGLRDEEYVAYWIGYVFEFDDPQQIQSVVKQLLNNEEYKKAVDDVLSQVGLQVNTIISPTFATLAIDEPEVFDTIKQHGMALTRPPLRIIPGHD